MPYHSRDTPKLLPGRVSLPGASYFLTWCTHHRVPNLSQPEIRSATLAAISEIERRQDGWLLAATVMPDHVHVLITLGDRLTVSQVVAKIKGTIARAHPSIHWQLNFFEHRLRNPSDAEGFAFYIFMNPYSANLCALDQTWPGWMPSPHIRWSFETKLHAGGFPQTEWIAEAACFAKTLPPGAD